MNRQRNWRKIQRDRDLAHDPTYDALLERLNDPKQFWVFCKKCEEWIVDLNEECLRTVEILEKDDADAFEESSTQTKERNCEGEATTKGSP